MHRYRKLIVGTGAGLELLVLPLGRPVPSRRPQRSTGRVCQRRRKPRNSSSARCGRSGLPALGDGTRGRAPGAGHCARLQRRPNGWHDPGEPGRPEPGKPGGTGRQEQQSKRPEHSRDPEWPEQLRQPRLQTGQRNSGNQGNSGTPETRATPVGVTPAVRVVTRVAGPLPLTEPKVVVRSWVWGRWVRPEIRLPRGRMPTLDERDRSVRATAQWLKGLRYCQAAPGLWWLPQV